MGSLAVHYEDVWFWHHWSEIFFAKTPRRTSILSTTDDFHKLFSIDLQSMADPKALQSKFSHNFMLLHLCSRRLGAGNLHNTDSDDRWKWFEKLWWWCIV